MELGSLYGRRKTPSVRVSTQYIPESGPTGSRDRPAKQTSFDSTQGGRKMRTTFRISTVDVVRIEISVFFPLF